MTATRRRAAITFAIAVLVGLNIWRWWPSPAPAAHPLAAAADFRVEDFEVRALPADARTPLTRDLFHPKRQRVVQARAKPVVQQPALVPPPKAPEVLARENAQAEFSQIRCVGISVRDKRIQAYLINGSDPLLVSAGDKAGSRFVVEKITPEGVVLKDPETGVGGQIAVSGK